MAAWNVYYHNFNRNQLEPYDLLGHGGFSKYASEYKKKYKSVEEFADKLKSELMYHFWSKCEWEVILTKENDRIIMRPWVGRRGETSLDVTDMEDFDWVGFYDKVAKKYIARDGSIKIDVYDQVMFRFREFIDYCWTHY